MRKLVKFSAGLVVNKFSAQSIKTELKEMNKNPKARMRQLVRDYKKIFSKIKDSDTENAKKLLIRDITTLFTECMGKGVDPIMALGLSVLIPSMRSEFNKLRSVIRKSHSQYTKNGYVSRAIQLDLSARMKSVIEAIMQLVVNNQVDPEVEDDATEDAEESVDTSAGVTKFSAEKSRIHELLNAKDFNSICDVTEKSFSVYGPVTEVPTDTVVSHRNGPSSSTDGVLEFIGKPSTDQSFDAYITAMMQEYAESGRISNARAFYNYEVTQDPNSDGYIFKVFMPSYMILVNDTNTEADPKWDQIKQLIEDNSLADLELLMMDEGYSTYSDRIKSEYPTAYRLVMN